MCDELNAKSTQEEKKVSEMNVTVENLHMNVSMQHRTVIGLVEDRKYNLISFQSSFLIDSDVNR